MRRASTVRRGRRLSTRDPDQEGKAHVDRMPTLLHCGGNPAVVEPRLRRPVTLRPRLSVGLALFACRGSRQDACPELPANKLTLAPNVCPAMLAGFRCMVTTQPRRRRAAGTVGGTHAQCLVRPGAIPRGKGSGNASGAGQRCDTRPVCTARRRVTDRSFSVTSTCVPGGIARGWGLCLSE